MHPYDYQRLIRTSALSSTERLVLLVLTTWGPDAETMQPVTASNDEIAAACAMSVRPLKIALKGLEAAGWIARARRPGWRSIVLQTPSAEVAQ